MAKRLLALAAMTVALTAAAPQPELVPEVSQRNIEIRYSFSGAELLLFGAILYPGGKIPKRPADVVVVLKGPSQSVTMREKQKLGGLIWVNADRADFRTVPSFYAVASSRPISKIVDQRTAAIYELGLDKLQLSPSSLNSGAEIDRFANGLNDLQSRKGLFVDRPGSVEITDHVLYQARLPLSARAIVGTYTAETFLVQDGRVVAAAVREIEVRKSGLERFIGVFSRREPLLYGLTAVAMAVGLGLLAGYIARRI